MSDPYGRVKGDRLTFKGGVLATRSKPIDKKKKKNKNKQHNQNPNPDHHDAVDDVEVDPSASVVGDDDSIFGAGGEYTIDAAKRLKYDDLFPVEAKKFGYEPKSKAKSVEAALDDRIKKKADRYCK